VAVKGFTTSGSAGGAAQEERLFDVVVAATDVPGIQRLLPESFRTHYKEFDNVFKLSAVPVVTVQLRCVYIAAGYCQYTSMMMR
jgi:zeta-carotene desaturase